MKNVTKKPKKESQLDIIARNVADIKSTMATKTELEEMKHTMATKIEVAEVKFHMATRDDMKDLKNRIIHVERQNEDIQTSITLIEKGEVPDVQHRIKILENDMRAIKKQVFQTA